MDREDREVSEKRMEELLEIKKKPSEVINDYENKKRIYSPKSNTSE